MSQFLSQHATYLSTASYQGKLYLIDYYPGVTPSENPNDAVHGEVFTIHDATAFDELDFFEGIGEGFPVPTEYVRELQNVTLNDSSTIDAYVYLFNWPIIGYTQITSGDFLTYSS